MFGGTHAPGLLGEVTEFASGGPGLQSVCSAHWREHGEAPWVYEWPARLTPDGTTVVPTLIADAAMSDEELAWSFARYEEWHPGRRVVTDLVVELAAADGAAARRYTVAEAWAIVQTGAGSHGDPVDVMDTLMEDGWVTWGPHELRLVAISRRAMAQWDRLRQAAAC